MTNAPLTYAAALVIAGAVGWVWYGRTAPDHAGNSDARRAASESPELVGQAGTPYPAGSTTSSGVEPLDTDREWLSFPREHVVVPALMSIPARLSPRDIYRDRELNPRDSFIRPVQRDELAAGVEDYISRIAEADRASAAAANRSQDQLALVEAVELTSEELAQAKRSGARVHKTLQSLLGGTGSETTPGGQTVDQVVAQQVRNRKVQKLAARGAGGEALASDSFSPDALWVEAVQLRELSVSLRIELFGLLTKRCTSFGILTDEESKGAVSRFVEQIRLAVALRPRHRGR